MIQIRLSTLVYLAVLVMMVVGVIQAIGGLK